MPTTIKCFEADYGQCSAVPRIDIPKNWLKLFAEACFAIDVTLTVPDLIQELNKHVGPHSKFTYKTQLKKELKEIYKRFMAEGEDKLNTDLKANIALKILEGVQNCSAGFYNRVILINQSFSIPNSLNALLTRIRHHIVNTSAIKAIARSDTIGNHVHLHNRFFLIASQHFGVQRIQEFDPYTGNLPDEIIRDLILEEFKEHYHSPLLILSNLCSEIKTVLQEHYYYSGRKDRGCIMADANHWASYLEKIGITYDSCFSFNYPYADESGACALIQTSSSPIDMHPTDLKILLKNLKGLIFFNNLLFYTDNSTPIKPLYEFSDSDDEEAAALKKQFLEMPINKIEMASAHRLNKLRANLGIECLYGTLVDLNWPKIKSLLLERLLNEGYLSASLFLSEEAMLQIFKEEEPNPDVFQHILADGYIPNINYFIHFIELFEHLNPEKKAKLVQQYIRTGTPDQKLILFLKLATLLKEVAIFSIVLEAYYYEMLDLLSIL